MKRGGAAANVALCLASIVLFAAAAEAFARFYLANQSYFPNLLPGKVWIGRKEGARDDAWIEGLVVRGQKVTRGDLWGLYRDDALLGYAPRENASSTNGWWRSNAIGARADAQTPKSPPPGVRRVLVFGESFANGSRVPQDETIPHFLNQKNGGVEFVNFGVDGYSMGQCLLRYETLKDRLDHDVVALVFVPVTDCWREINVLRQLNGWSNYPLCPRFVLDRGRLELVRSPYATYEELRRENEDVPLFSDRLRRHLEKYDRLYPSLIYASPPLLGRLLSFRILMKRIGHALDVRVRNTAMDRRSEAVAVTRAVIRRMDAEARQSGRKFVLIYLPFTTDVGEYRRSATLRRRWKELTEATARDGVAQIDLMEDCLQIDRSRFDIGYDKSHYGPKSNRLLADLIWKHLNDLHIFDPRPETPASA